MRQRKGQRKGERLPETLDRILPRIGTEPRDRLRWLVGLVQRPPAGQTAGDRENLRLELGAFIYADGPRGRWIGTVSFTESGPVYDNWLPEGKIKPILRWLGEMVTAAVRREPVWLDPGVRRERRGLFWSQDRGRFYEAPSGEVSWDRRAARALANLLKDYGHLLRECPAPAIRAKAGETCGVWFVAQRPDQEYCSTTCRSRAGARAWREKNGGSTRMGRKEGVR